MSSMQPAPAPATGGKLGKVQIWVAVALIVVFIATLVVLAVMRADQNWDRLMYLLSGFEAIVFAAVGALFGVTVQRGAVDSAQKDAATARAEANTERARADENAEDARSGRKLSDLVQERLAPQQRQTLWQGARPKATGEAPGDETTDDLTELYFTAKALFPNR